MNARQRFAKSIGHKHFAELIVAEFKRQGQAVTVEPGACAVNEGDRLIVDAADGLAFCSHFAIFTNLEYGTLAEVVAEYL